MLKRRAVGCRALVVAWCIATRASGRTQPAQNGSRTFSRLLSASDFKTHEGTVAAPPGHRSRHYVFVHIPKAAGASFMKDSPKFMMAGDTLRGSQETAARSPVTFARLKAKQPSSRVVFLRHPLQLVYSQFLYCKYVLKRKNPGFPRGRGDEGEAGGLEAWVAHVSGGRDAYKCYHPRDVQFRFVVGAGDARAPEGVPVNVGAAAARRALDADFSMVGVVEAYRESLCLFRWLGERRAPPAYCGCGATAAFPKVEHAHRMKYNSSVLAVAPRSRAALAGLVAAQDVLLYVHGLSVFERRVEEARNATGVQLVCPETLRGLWARALDLACALRPYPGDLLRDAYDRSCYEYFDVADRAWRQHEPGVWQ